MPIYGVALLAGCTLVGLFVGDLIGAAMGLEANVGGVGIAMLLLLALTNLPGRDVGPASPSGAGVQFWSLMYIPIIVAMAAKQNVAAAVSGGAMAITAGTLAVLAGFALVPLLSHLARGGGQRGERRDD
ncbi:malonate transporter subunit MadL [Sandarakinorhabdus cyanobacteriorum]|uniref:Malonate transporter subunit MadL n=1 Tax=Sandarakinorhabdus cyanobacteriorum TaxID=1981098 RepID=A0A255YS77_9SPHN|nr:malonate transporter subunit MadL [Sandarakinorhabdus cyanobacteriorum]OYQ32047.1 malonate transporter subunit MadL [Sandarakinorhabdus cyanobacteriorum]